MPAFQEGKTIRRALTRLVDTLEGGPSEFEIIVVADGCTDNTADEVRLLTERFPITVIEYEPNRGKGFALRTGAEKAIGDYVAFFDADLDIDPRTLNVLYGQLLNSRADGVVGSKFHRQSIVKYPLVRRLQSKVFILIIFALFRLKIRDTQTGAKVFRGNLVRQVVPSIVPTGFGFDVELLVKSHDLGFRIEEGPVILTYQYSSSVRFRTVIHMLREIMEVYRRR